MIQERFLCLLLKSCKDDFQDLQRSSGDISIHQSCINSLLTKYTNIFMVFLLTSYRRLIDFETTLCVYWDNTRPFNVSKTLLPTSNRYGLNLIPYKFNNPWNLLHQNLKSFPSLTLFKNKTKLWGCFNFSCNIYKSYVPNLAYCVLHNQFFSYILTNS